MTVVLEAQSSEVATVTDGLAPVAGRLQSERALVDESSTAKRSVGSWSLCQT